MKTIGLRKKPIIFLALIVTLALLASPALAGNTATVSGEILAPQGPEAQFIGTPASGYAPLAVQFTDQSTNTPNSWKWEYQRGSSGSWTQFSTDQNPSYTFTTAGTYSIRLTATNTGGSDVETKSNSITVTAPAKPVAKYTAAPTRGLTPLTVQFTDQSTNSPTSWRWEYRLGSGSWKQFSTDQNPTYTFTTTGTYSIRLTATNTGGSDDETKTNYITVTSPPKPVAKYTAAPTRGLTPLTVQFTDQSTNSPTSWKWEYRIGSSGSWKQFSTDQNPSYTFTTTGTYSIRLTATNTGGSDDETKSNSITVTAPAKPAAKYTATPTRGLTPLTVQFTDQSTNTPTSWKWEYRIGSSGSWKQFSTDQNPSYTFTTVGTYSIRLTATNTGGSDDETKSNSITVTAPAKTVAKYTAAPTRGLTPLTVQFTDQSTNTPTLWKWEYRIGSSGSWKQFSTDQNPTYTFTTNGTYSIRLTATNAGGSDDETKSNSITVGHTGSVAASFTASPTRGLTPLTVQFTDKSSGSIDTWEWDFQNDGKYDSTVKNPTFTYTTKKQYAVKLRVTNADHTSTRIRYNYINVK